MAVRNVHKTKAVGDDKMAWTIGEWFPSLLYVPLSYTQFKLLPAVTKKETLSKAVAQKVCICPFICMRGA